MTAANKNWKILNSKQISEGNSKKKWNFAANKQLIPDIQQSIWFFSFKFFTLCRFSYPFDLFRFAL